MGQANGKRRFARHLSAGTDRTPVHGIIDPAQPQEMVVQLNTEINGAKTAYTWLWFSPLLTIPTVIYVAVNMDPGQQLICGGSYLDCDYHLAGYITSVSAVLISALWHVLVLVPGWNEKNEFVRWHRRQALLLAAIRTLAPLVLLAYAYLFENGQSENGLFLSIPVLILIWLIGTIWAQGQAARGECSLMRWAGHGEGLPLKIENSPAAASKDVTSGGDMEESEELVDIIRYNRDPEQRQDALAELERRGLVEPLDGPAPA